ncbi:MAG: hypothetical protein JWO43_475 [Candidatus Adlerbacteria bacterium]|nr:hypothetical protein [Candidatus Adlerbacteria bacterium]
MHGAFVYTLAAGIFTGVALQLLLGWGSVAAFILLIAACAALFFARRNTQWLYVAVACASLCVGLVRADMFAQSERQETVTQFVSNHVTLAGSVAADPDERTTSVRTTISVDVINNEIVHGIVVAVLPRDTRVAYGDTIEVAGNLVLPESFITDTGREFDYPNYLRTHGVVALVEKAELVSNTSGGFSLNGFLYAAKHTFEQSIERTLPEPHAALLEGVLLGEKRGLPKSLSDAFITSGLVHVVVLSGHNISVVAEGIFRALAFLPRTASMSLGGVGIVLFALMSGAGAATVRACIMAIVALLARYFHRSAIALRALFLAGAAMVLWNPPSMLYDPGFVLSMLATFGLITLSPTIEEHIPVRFVRRQSLRSIIATTISVQIFVLPMLLYQTGLMSIYALPANVLALPVVPAAMLFGFVAGLLGFLSPLLALIPALIAQALLAWMMWVAQTAALLPGASAAVDVFPAWAMAAAYAPLTWWALKKYSAVYRKSVSQQQTNSDF